jgi:Tol biopolymer transport system component
MFVEFWMMDYDGRNKKKLLPLFGGQGSINVNSWAKDSRHLAFVSYELLHK